MLVEMGQEMAGDTMRVMEEFLESLPAGLDYFRISSWSYA